jgi:hypothetical protein
MSRRFALMALMLALATASALAYQWVQLTDFNGYGAQNGSALCAGVTTGADDVTRNCVYMLHGGYGQFERYDTDLDSWKYKACIPSIPNRIYSYPGGALCYVPDPYASPQNGWVFAFPGSMSTTYPSREFWVYHPEYGTSGAGDTGKWKQATNDVPDNTGGVIEGAALCYGGTTMIGTRSYAVIYAFNGQDHYVNGDWHGHFFRYMFELVPYDQGGSAPEDGEWDELTPVPDKVKLGGALVWLPNPDAEHAGPPWVIAATAGRTDDYLWRYEAAAQYEWTGTNPELDDNEGEGCCLARLNGDGVIMLYGGGSSLFSAVLPAEPGHSGSIWTGGTPYETSVKAGAAVAELDGMFYAEFGEDNYSIFWALDPSGGGGGQSAAGAGSPATFVAVRAGRGQSKFTVHCQPGPVSLKLINSAGTVVSTVKTEARSGLAELTWPHGSSASGAYLYVVTTRSGTVTGKLTVVR